jgi:hypothetical protein
VEQSEKSSEMKQILQKKISMGVVMVAAQITATK